MPRLLVIDDDYLHRKIICRVASKAGYAPAGAATYDEAAKLALDNAFDCISLDLSLGQHGGTEMLHYLRGIGCKAPVVIISGGDEVTFRETLKVAKSLNLDIRESMLKAGRSGNAEVLFRADQNAAPHRGCCRVNGLFA